VAPGVLRFTEWLLRQDSWVAGWRPAQHVRRGRGAGFGAQEGGPACRDLSSVQETTEIQQNAVRSLGGAACQSPSFIRLQFASRPAARPVRKGEVGRPVLVAPAQAALSSPAFRIFFCAPRPSPPPPPAAAALLSTPPPRSGAPAPVQHCVVLCFWVL
jgi:hypothetical protein